MEFPAKSIFCIFDMNEFESDFHSNVRSRYSSVIVSKVDFSE